MMTIANRCPLDRIGAMPIGEIAALPADQLALLQEEADSALQAAKTVRDRLEAGIALRYAERAQALRREQGKDGGTVRFADGEVTIVADLPKRIDWDQGQLAAVVERIRAASDDPAEYVEITFKVPERRFAAWPERIRATFAPARTVRTGKPSFALSLDPSP